MGAFRIFSAGVGCGELFGLVLQAFTISTRSFSRPPALAGIVVKISFALFAGL